jgi:hypothetical protein
VSRTPVPPGLLHRRWVHSHEEDSDTEMVFRPDTFDFPASRGRVSFELREDGTFLDRGIGATDRSEEAAGTWQLEDGERVVLRESGTDQVRRRLDITSVEPDRLVLRK